MNIFNPFNLPSCNVFSLHAMRILGSARWGEIGGVQREGGYGQRGIIEIFLIY